MDRLQPVAAKVLTRGEPSPTMGLLTWPLAGERSMMGTRPLTAGGGSVGGARKESTEAAPVPAVQLLSDREAWRCDVSARKGST